MKKKILAVSLAVMIVVIALTGTSLAYLTDTDEATNVFTTGTVEIELTEADVVADAKGNLIADPAGTRHNGDYDYGKLFPAMSVTKDPTIKNIGTDDVYVAAKITVSAGEGDLESVLGTGYMGLLGIQDIVSGGYVKENDTLKSGYNGLSDGGLPVYGDDTYSVYQEVEEDENGNKLYVFYIFIETPIAPDGTTGPLFTTITIPEEWDNDEMEEFKDFTITVKAYGTQTVSFESCFEAMTKSFSDDFDF